MHETSLAAGGWRGARDHGHTPRPRDRRQGRLPPPFTPTRMTRPRWPPPTHHERGEPGNHARLSRDRLNALGSSGVPQHRDRVIPTQEASRRAPPPHAEDPAIPGTLGMTPSACRGTEKPDRSRSASPGARAGEQATWGSGRGGWRSGVDAGGAGRQREEDAGQREPGVPRGSSGIHRSRFRCRAIVLLRVLVVLRGQERLGHPGARCPASCFPRPCPTSAPFFVLVAWPRPPCARCGQRSRGMAYLLLSARRARRREGAGSTRSTRSAVASNDRGMEERAPMTPLGAPSRYHTNLTTTMTRRDG